MKRNLNVNIVTGVLSCRSRAQMFVSMPVIAFRCDLIATIRDAVALYCDCCDKIYFPEKHYQARQIVIKWLYDCALARLSAEMIAFHYDQVAI